MDEPLGTGGPRHVEPSIQVLEAAQWIGAEPFVGADQPPVLRLGLPVDDVYGGRPEGTGPLPKTVGAGDEIRVGSEVVFDQPAVLEQRAWVRLPAQPLPALELAARVSHHEQLPRMGKVGGEPGQVEVGVHQLHQHVPLAKVEKRKALGDPEAPAPAERGDERPGVLPHREPRGQSARQGARHQAAVRGVVVVAGEVQGAKPILRLRYHVHVVGLTVVGEVAREGQALGEPAGAAPGQARDDDASPFLHGRPPFGGRDL